MWKNLDQFEGYAVIAQIEKFYFNLRNSKIFGHLGNLKKLYEQDFETQSLKFPKKSGKMWIGNSIKGSLIGKHETSRFSNAC